MDRWWERRWGERAGVKAHGWWGDVVGAKRIWAGHFDCCRNAFVSGMVDVDDDDDIGPSMTDAHSLTSQMEIEVPGEISVTMRR